jgi:hypothetical protein
VNAEIQEAVASLLNLDARAPAHIKVVCDELFRLDALINTPQTSDFAHAVVLEAAHQRQIWTASDRQKTNDQWYWTIGYLAGKALWNPGEGGTEKRLHRIIATAAVACNWHKAVQEGQV